MAQCTVSVTLRDKLLIRSHCYHNHFTDVTVKEHDYVINKTHEIGHSAPYLQQHLYNFYTERCSDGG